MKRRRTTPNPLYSSTSSLDSVSRYSAAVVHSFPCSSPSLPSFPNTVSLSFSRLHSLYLSLVLFFHSILMTFLVFPLLHSFPTSLTAFLLPYFPFHYLLLSFSQYSFHVHHLPHRSFLFFYYAFLPCFFYCSLFFIFIAFFFTPFISFCFVFFFTSSCFLPPFALRCLFLLLRRMNLLTSFALSSALLFRIFSCFLCCPWEPFTITLTFCLTTICLSTTPSPFS